MKRRGCPWGRLCGVGALVVLTALVGLVAGPAPAANRLEITSRSNRPDKASGGDVLAMVRAPRGTSLGDVTVTLNGTDVTGAFWADPENHALVGLVTGLRVGSNTLEAKARRAGTDRLELQDHPITGPVFSGPQERPFFCQTHQFRPYPNAPFLTASPIEDPCHVPTRVDYVYRSTSNAFGAFDPTAPLPADLAMTLTGVPYIVRLETGTSTGPSTRWPSSTTRRWRGRVCGITPIRAGTGGSSTPSAADAAGATTFRAHPPEGC
jgi:hypothetical protein